MRNLWMTAAVCALVLAARLPANNDEDYAGRFDRMDARVNNGQGYSASLNTSGLLAWGESYILQAYVEMYRATNSRAYLDNLVEHFERALANRDDVRKVSDFYRKKPMPGWGSDEYSNKKWRVWAVHDGMICLGPIEFVRVVKAVSGLRRAYGKKADEFRAKIAETVAGHDPDWREGPGPDEGHYNDPAIGPLPLNQQNALGSVLVELYQITRDNLYRDRAEKLANYFKKRLRKTPNGAYDWAYWPKPDGSGAGSEDISHAAINIDFAVRCRWAHIVFNDRDMKAFAKTWTARVRRADGEWADTIGGAGGPNTHMPQAAGRWLDLCPFDRSIFEDAKQAFAAVNEEQASGANLLGLAKLARWERELKKRVNR